MRRYILILVFLALIGFLAQIRPVSGQSAPQRQLEFTIGNSNLTKSPGVTTYNDKVYIGSVISTGGSSGTDAWSWSLGDQASGIAWESRIGGLSGQANFSSVALASGSNGDIHAVWSSADEGRIYYSRLPSGSQTWGSVISIASGKLMFFPQIAVYKSDVYIIWNQVNSPLSLKVYRNGSWSGPYYTQHKTFSTFASVTTGPTGQVAIGYTTIDHAMAVAIFNGTSLSDVHLGRGFDSSIAIDKNGVYYSAWRSDGTGGYLAESSNGVNWSVRQVVPGTVLGSLNVVVDSGGTTHLGWVSNISGNLQGYYTYRLAGQSNFMTAAATNSIGLFNSDLAISSDGRYAHFVAENFNTSPQKILYARFAGAPGVGVSATPMIAGGANTVGVMGKSSISVSFTDLRVVQGNKYQVRWNWGSAPTDANAWEEFDPADPNIEVSVPSVASCSTATLYTQIKDFTSGVVEVPAKNDSVLIDSNVQGQANLTNPYIALGSLSSADSLATELALSKGAMGVGDPNHTRIVAAYLNVSNSGDCSGISSVTLTHNGLGNQTYKLVDNDYKGFVTLPDLANLVTGSWPVTVTIQDGAGNSQTTTVPMVFDDVAPSFISADQPTATANPQADILQNLTFSNVNVSDNLYRNGTRQFWGVWLANSTSGSADPATLNWIAVPVEDVSGTTVRVRNWSLTAGLAEPLPTPGTRTTYIYVRFLDGAGNATNEPPLRIDVSSNFNSVKVNLPAVMR